MFSNAMLLSCSDADMMLKSCDRSEQLYRTPRSLQPQVSSPIYFEDFISFLRLSSTEILVLVNPNRLPTRRAKAKHDDLKKKSQQRKQVP